MIASSKSSLSVNRIRNSTRRCCAVLLSGVSITFLLGGGCPSGVGRPCGIDSFCFQGHFCKFPDGECRSSGFGVCVVLPEVCPEIFAPVCGCDDQTYGNECEANAAGVSVASEGECPQPQ